MRKAAIGPTLPTWALPEVGRYLGYTGRDAGILREAALDHTRHYANTTALDPELSALAARVPQSSAERALRQEAKQHCRIKKPGVRAGQSVNIAMSTVQSINSTAVVSLMTWML